MKNPSYAECPFLTQARRWGGGARSVSLDGGRHCRMEVPFVSKALWCVGKEKAMRHLIAVGSEQRSGRKH